MEGLEVEDDLLVAADSGWPTVRIAIDRVAVDPGKTQLNDDGARYPIAGEGRVDVDRRGGLVSFRGPDPPTPDEIAHPHFGMLGALYAQWLPGRMAFHAGAFVSGDRAWAVVGGRQDGKSTLMAALAMSGLSVLGDDTLVVDANRCLSGVRCIDLRPDAATRLGVRGSPTVRRGARVRLFLGTPPRAVPLAGWLFLRWADDVAIRRIPTPELMGRIGRSQGWHRRGVTAPGHLLDASTLPGWELSRPRDWKHAERALALVRELPEASAA